MSKQGEWKTKRSVKETSVQRGSTTAKRFSSTRVSAAAEGRRLHAEVRRLKGNGWSIRQAFDDEGAES